MMAKKEIIKKTVKNEDETVMEQPIVEAPANVEAKPENETIAEDVDVIIEHPGAMEEIAENIEYAKKVLDEMTGIPADYLKEKPQPTPTRVKFWNGYSY